MHTNGYWPIYNITHSSNAGPGHTNESAVKFFAFEIAGFSSENMLASLAFLANYFVTNSLRFVLFDIFFFLLIFSFLYPSRRFPTYLDRCFLDSFLRNFTPCLSLGKHNAHFRHKHQLVAVNCIF